MIRSLATFSMLVVLLAAFFGCSPQKAAEETPASSNNSGAQSAPASGGGSRIAINIGTPPDTLDLSKMHGIPEHKIALVLCEPHVRLDQDLNAEPGASERWESNEDATVWTFHLRKDGKWHDGKPVTAQDFLFAHRRVLNQATGAKYADFMYRFLKGGEAYYNANDPSLPLPGITAPDDYTVIYELDAPTPIFPVIIAHTAWFPIPKHAVEAAGASWASSDKFFIGNGAFEMVSWRPDRIVGRKSQHYWGRNEVHFDEVVIRMIEDTNSELAAFEAKEIDVTDKVLVTEVDRLKRTPDWFAGPYLGVYYGLFNTTVPPFNNKDVRRAFMLSVNRDLIVNQITRRGERPGQGMIPWGIKYPDGKDYREAAGDLVGPTDVAAAKEALARAGYGPGGKTLPRVEYLYNTDITHRMVGEQLQTMWREALGVTAQLQNVEWKEKLRRGQNQEFQITRAGWIGDYNDPITFLEIFLSNDGNNDGRYNNPKFDELVRNAMREGDWKKRRDLVIQAEKILIEDAALCPIFFYTEPILVRADLEGVIRNPIGNLDITRARRR